MSGWAVFNLIAALMNATFVAMNVAIGTPLSWGVALLNAAGFGFHVMLLMAELTRNKLWR